MAWGMVNARVLGVYGVSGNLEPSAMSAQPEPNGAGQARMPQTTGFHRITHRLLFATAKPALEQASVRRMEFIAPSRNCITSLTGSLIEEQEGVCMSSGQ